MLFIMKVMVILCEIQAQGYEQTHSCHILFWFGQNSNTVSFNVLLSIFLCNLIEMFSSCGITASV